jgi:tRNA(Ile)-lysidine synthase
MSHPLEDKLAATWPLADWADVTVLIAVSGGGDSVALLRAIAALKTSGQGRLCVAHLNHQLRPDADDDERFVVELSARLGLTCEVARVPVQRLADESGDGVEAAARSARYRFLQDAAGRLGARFVATAHTADDQAETILHRILRGTGVRGLAGMARVRPLGHASLIRPLLGVGHAELTAYLDAIGQPYRHDASNRDRRFMRNRIRHELLPRLCRQYNPRAVEALLRLATLAGQSQAIIDRLVNAWFDRCVTIESPSAARIELADLVAEPRYLIGELLAAVWRRQGWPLQSMDRRKWDELCEMTAAAPPVRRVFPGEVTVEVAERRMRLSRSVR